MTLFAKRKVADIKNRSSISGQKRVFVKFLRINFWSFLRFV